MAVFFFLPSFAVELKRNVQNGVTNSDLGTLHCHSEFISESLPYRFRNKFGMTVGKEWVQKKKNFTFLHFIDFCMINKDFVHFLSLILHNAKKENEPKERNTAGIIRGHPRTPV